jgi:integrase
MRGLFKWAKEAEAGYVPNDPAASVAYPVLKESEDGFPMWDDEDVAAYERYYPLGTRERVWYAVLRYTGMRRGDAVRLGRQHVRNGVLTIRTAKTGAEVHLEVLPELQEAIDAGPTADLAFICGATGKQMTKESFGNAFSEACRKAGVRKSAHGLRKLAATTAAMNGANPQMLNALFGWHGAKMAMHYTKNADSARLGRENTGKLRTEVQQNSAAPLGKVRRASPKSK